MIAELGHDHFAGFGMGAMRAMMDHDWPGNVRELKNVVERAVYRAGFSAVSIPLERIDIDPFDSPWRPAAPAPGAAVPPAADARPAAAAPNVPAAPMPAPGAACDFKALVAEYERLLVARALREAGGHQGHAAQGLSLTYHQLRNLIRKHGLSDAA
jgi:psp operon transcriptional activator